MTREAKRALGSILSESEHAIQAIQTAVDVGTDSLDRVAGSAATRGPIYFSYACALSLMVFGIVLRATHSIGHTDLRAVTAVVIVLVVSAGLLAAADFRAYSKLNEKITTRKLEAIAEEAKARNERFSEVMKLSGM